MFGIGKFWKNGVGVLLLLLTALIFVLPSCADEEASTEVGKLEDCKLLLDQQAWTSAIASCSAVGNDEGWRLTGQAYMGRAGLSMFGLLRDLSSGEVDAQDVVFLFVPDTTADAKDYKSALDSFMAQVEKPTASMYLQSVLLSSMLIFRELKDLLGLQINAKGDFVSCAGNPPSVENCDFAPIILYESVTLGQDKHEVPKTMQFAGLGKRFYNNICNHSIADPSHDGITTIDITVDSSVDIFDDKIDGVHHVAYDVTADGCTIKTNSVLYYNKVANEKLKGFEGLSDLSVLNFYPKFDTGENYSVDITDVGIIKFCNKDDQDVPIIEAPAKKDLKLNDCEILSFLVNPGF